MLTVVPEGCPDHEGARADAPSLIDEIVREGARRMLAGALRAEVDAYKALAEIWGAEDKQHDLAAVKSSGAAYGTTFPKAAAKITDLVERPEAAAA